MPNWLVFILGGFVKSAVKAIADSVHKKREREVERKIRIAEVKAKQIEAEERLRKLEVKRFQDALAWKEKERKLEAQREKALRQREIPSNPYGRRADDEGSDTS